MKHYFLQPLIAGLVSITRKRTIWRRLRRERDSRLGRSSFGKVALIGLLSAACLLSACGSTGPAFPPAPVQIGRGAANPGAAGPDNVTTSANPTRNTSAGYGLIPPHMADRAFSRIAILLPFGSSNASIRDESLNMLAAAELALFELKDKGIVILPFDSGGTQESAERAARDAIASGADMIIGPLLAAEVRGAYTAAKPASRPIIAFSTDVSVAGNGAYLLSSPPEEEVERIVEFATRNGVTNFFVFAPDREYGARVTQTVQIEAAKRNARLVQSQTYTRSTDPRAIKEMEGPARALAGAVKALPASAGRKAIIIPDRGDALKAAMPLLAGYGVDPRTVLALGTSLWGDTDLSKEPSYTGSVFAASDPAGKMAFAQRFEAAFQRKPSRITSAGYDAMSLAIRLNRVSGGPGYNREGLEHEQGFLGVDGLFRLRADGLIDRGLAILEITPAGVNVREPGPTSFPASGS